MVPTMLTTYPSPLQWQDWEDWEDCLANHPDRRFAAYITNEIEKGFGLATTIGPTCTLQPTIQK